LLYLRKKINPSGSGKKMASFLSNLFTRTSAAMGSIDLLSICGRRKSLSKLRFGSG
jgi:hypothetical protein